VTNIDANECADRVIMPVAEKTPAMGRAVEAHGKAIFKRAQQMGWYPQEKLNPFSRKGPLGLKLEELEVLPPKHLAGLPAAEIPAFMQRLRKPRGGTAMTLAEAARAVGIDRSEILRAIHKGNIQAFRREFEGEGWKSPWFIQPEDLFKVYPQKNALIEIVPLRWVANLALQFIILLAARPEQVLTMRWGEYSRDERLWTVPWHRHKAGRKTHQPLYLPVSSAAMAVIDQAEKFQKSDIGARSEFIFAHGRSLTWNGTYDARPMDPNAIQTAFDAAIGRPGLTVYGFRGAFSTWAYEKAGKYYSDAIEMSLGHVRRTYVDAQGSRRTDTTREAYDHAQLLPERRRLMEDWGNHCTSPAPAPSQVIIEAAEVFARKAKA
jgi:integrase